MDLPIPSLLLVAHDAEKISALRRVLAPSTLAMAPLQVSATELQAIELLQQQLSEAPVILLACAAVDEESILAIRRFHEHFPLLTLLVLADHLPASQAIKAIEAGAQEALSWPELTSSSLERAILCASTRQKCLNEQKLIEQQQDKQKILFTESQKLAKIGNWELDLNGNILTWSAEVFRIFEIDPERFVASYESFLALVHPDDRKLLDQAYSYSVKNRTSYNFEHRLLFADGRIKYVHERGETHYDAEGKALRSIGTVQDISERKQAERRVSEHSARYHTLFQESPISLWEEDFSAVKLFLEQLHKEGIGDLATHL
ncbi:PAS domain-containing protein, partial [Candidatus Magnetaquicoccus inordinatus]|uniref:PAS domain-containing protein n=1 Tax=Candidatus Magnetaquicoccus inordinatus TaxID=2496818 RepID=UPI00102BEAB7